MGADSRRAGNAGSARIELHSEPHQVNGHLVPHVRNRIRLALHFKASGHGKPAVMKLLGEYPEPPLASQTCTKIGGPELPGGNPEALPCALNPGPCPGYGLAQTLALRQMVGERFHPAQRVIACRDAQKQIRGQQTAFGAHSHKAFVQPPAHDCSLLCLSGR